MTKTHQWIERDGLILLEVAHGRGWLATFSLTGAQLLSFHSQDVGTEMFWLQENSPASSEASWRGGVPLVFPWFGPSAKGAPYPQHGFVRNAPWKFMGVMNFPTETVVQFSLTESSTSRVFWDHAFELLLTVRLRPGKVTTALRVTNTDDKPFEFEALLHPYFKLEQLAGTEVTGVDSAAHYDKVADSRAVQNGAVTFESTVDRVFDHASGEVLILENGKPSLKITKENSTQTVVWNPGAGNRPGAIAPAFVCVEPGCVREGKLTLSPGESHELIGTFEKLSGNN